MNHFKDLKIDKDISVWASGESKDKIPKDDIDYIKSKTFTIGINLFRLFTPDAYYWMDRKVSEYFDDKYTAREKDAILVTRPNAFAKNKKLELQWKIDYFFDEKEENKKEYWRDGNFTLWMLLMMLRHYFHGKKVYLFGVDCENSKTTTYEDGKIVTRETKAQEGHIKSIQRCFETEKNVNPPFFYSLFNCNPDSKVKTIKFFDYRNII